MLKEKRAILDYARVNEVFNVMGLSKVIALLLKQ